MIKILALVDEKKSSLNQCESLIENITKYFKIKVTKKVVKRIWINKFPNVVIYFYLIFKNYFVGSDKTNFDLIISAGRICAPYNLVEKKKKQIKIHSHSRSIPIS